MDMWSQIGGWILILLQAGRIAYGQLQCDNLILEANWRQQTISTPGHPKPYPKDLNCAWLITVARGSQIELKFSVFDTEQQYDTLRIYDGRDDTAPLLSLLEGNIHAQTTIVSSAGFLFLQFSSDNSVSRRGFLAHYRIALPSKMTVTSVIQSCLAQTTITKEIKNLDSERREVDFKIDFPIDAYITQFAMTVGLITFFGEVKRRESIRQEYKDVDVQWVSMGYVSSTKEIAKKFFTGILLDPGVEATFRIEYQQLLQRRIGRYTNPLILTRDFLLSDLSVDVYICARSKLTFVQIPPIQDAGNMSYADQVKFLGQSDYSPENVKVSKEGNVAHISFRSIRNGNYEPIPSHQNVFVTHYDVERDKTGTLSVFGGEYFATFYSPENPKLSRRVVFVLDVSGSMAGNKIEQVKIAITNILKGLMRKDAFNIVQFESRIRKWHQTGLVAATPQAKQDAKKYLESFDPEGQTNINEALLTGLELLFQGVENEPIRKKLDTNPSRDFIFFLGDGKPTVGVRNTEAILRGVTKANRRGYGINAIGFGRNVDINFLRRLTIDNRGQYRIIYEDDNSHIQIQNFITEIGIPTVTDVAFSFNPNHVNYTTQRKNLVMVHGGEVAVFGRLLPNLTESEIKVGVSGKTFRMVRNNFKFKISENLRMCESIGDKLITKFVERAYGISKLEETLERLRQSTDPDESEDITKELNDISLQFSLVTPVTSLVVRRKNETGNVEKKPDVFESPNKREKEPVAPGELTDGLPGEAQPWIFEGDPHFIVALEKNITVCFTWNGTDGQMYNLLHDPVTGITVNGLIKYGPRAPNATHCQENQDYENQECQEEIESFFVKLGFYFFKERVKVEVTPRTVVIRDERKHKHVREIVLPASDETSFTVIGHVGVKVHNITKVHSFVNVTLRGTVAFVINMKRRRNLPENKTRPGLIDHLDMDVIGHSNLSPMAGGLFGIFPKDVKSSEKKTRGVATARLRKPQKGTVLQYRNHRIAVEEIVIDDPYSKEPQKCWFTYEETSVTGRQDDAFIVDNIFAKPSTSFKSKAQMRSSKILSRHDKEERKV